MVMECLIYDKSNVLGEKSISPCQFLFLAKFSALQQILPMIDPIVKGFDSNIYRYRLPSPYFKKAFERVPFC